MDELVPIEIEVSANTDPTNDADDPTVNAVPTFQYTFAA